jgi:phospholipase C
VACAAASAIAACSAGASSVPAGVTPSVTSPQSRHPEPFDFAQDRLRRGARGDGRGASPIKHVVFIIQENRSFNDLFMGFPGATTSAYGYKKNGRKIRLRAQKLETSWDIDHNAAAFFTACDGDAKLPGTRCTMDGWNGEYAYPKHPPNPAYAYVPHKEIEPYWALAKQYVLADRMFASNLDGSFVAHQYLIAAYASRSVDLPAGAWGCSGGASNLVATLTPRRRYGPSIAPCYDNPTIGSEADSAGVSWRFYSGSIYGDGGLWSSYWADRQVFDGPDWKANVINPPSQFLTDVRNGKLANVTWITPTYEASDHAGVRADKGPAWIASLVNAIGESKVWDSTAIFIMWDDWGGWYDPVPPVYEDYDGLGFRVPLLIVSPYAKLGYVTHVQYETSSVLRFIEDNFGLPQLAKSDARANDPVTDAFDYGRQPRKFKHIGGAVSASYWIVHERPSGDETKGVHILGDD